MQFSTLTIAAFAALSSAAVLKRAPADLCPALDTPQCCQLDVDGVADLTCSARESNETSISPERCRPANTSITAESDLTTVDAFEKSCKSTGLTAMCCTLPVVRCCTTVAVRINSLLTPSPGRSCPSLQCSVDVYGYAIPLTPRPNLRRVAIFLRR